MHAKHAAIRLMQPSEDEHFLPNAEILRCVGVLRRDHEPRVGGTLVTLLRRVDATDERRAHSANGIQRVLLVERRVIRQARLGNLHRRSNGAHRDLGVTSSPIQPSISRAQLRVTSLHPSEDDGPAFAAEALVPIENCRLPWHVLIAGKDPNDAHACAFRHVHRIDDVLIRRAWIPGNLDDLFATGCVDRR